ncbi:MAG: hypothetical protein ABI622_06780 [Chloroflexota bacterium]
MHRPAAPDAQVREPNGEYDQVPVARVGGGGNDRSSRAEGRKPPRECLRRGPLTGEVLDVDAQRLARRSVPQIDHGEPVDLHRPEATLLVGRIDGTAGGGAPLRPGGLLVQRRIERPRIAGAMPPCGRRGGHRWGEGGDPDAGLPEDATAEGGEARRQTMSPAP